MKPFFVWFGSVGQPESDADKWTAASAVEAAEKAAAALCFDSENFENHVAFVRDENGTTTTFDVECVSRPEFLARAQSEAAHA